MGVAGGGAKDAGDCVVGRRGWIRNEFAANESRKIEFVGSSLVCEYMKRSLICLIDTPFNV